jgi:hypothetical protein
MPINISLDRNSLTMRFRSPILFFMIAFRVALRLQIPCEVNDLPLISASECFVAPLPALACFLVDSSFSPRFLRRIHGDSYYWDRKFNVFPIVGMCGVEPCEATFSLSVRERFLSVCLLDKRFPGLTLRRFCSGLDVSPSLRRMLSFTWPCVSTLNLKPQSRHR